MEMEVNTSSSSIEANEIVCFNDGRMTPKNDTKIYFVIKKAFWIILVLIALGSIVFNEFLLAGESLPIWTCFVVIGGYLLKNRGYERVECPSEIHFYDEYMVFYVPKHHLRQGKDQMEIQKISYCDVTKCQFRTNIRKVEIYGMLEEVHYEYDAQGVVNKTPSYQKRYDGMIKFYTVFDYQHDFVEIIERNTPLKVDLENC